MRCGTTIAVISGYADRIITDRVVVRHACQPQTVGIETQPFGQTTAVRQGGRKVQRATIGVSKVDRRKREVQQPVFKNLR